ncbi:MAG: hypothetical protein HQK76_02125 [Desulfobacterales bacterium]|nr:hypothetical protein [Desulfobacterales bacterium]
MENNESKVKLLLEAHVNYELNCFKGNNLKKTIEDEINALFDWFSKTHVKDIITQNQLEDIILENLIKDEVPNEAIDTIIDFAKELHTYVEKDETIVEDVISKENHDKVADVVISMEELRHELIYQVVSGSIYSRMLSDVLYNGIKEFMLTSENIVNKFLPGASALIKMGQGFINKAAPKLEETIDKQLKVFITANIKKFISQSEKFLNGVLDEKFLKKVSNEIWDSVSKQKISYVTDYYYPDHTESLTPILNDIWFDFRHTNFFNGLNKELIRYFFEKFGNDTVLEFFNKIGLKKELIIKKALNIVAPIIERESVINHIEERIRYRLTEFYNSQNIL